MPGKCLGDLRRNVGADKVRDERMPQGVEVREKATRIFIQKKVRFLAFLTLLFIRRLAKPNGSRRLKVELQHLRSASVVPPVRCNIQRRNTIKRITFQATFSNQPTHERLDRLEIMVARLNAQPFFLAQVDKKPLHVERCYFVDFLPATKLVVASNLANNFKNVLRRIVL